MPAYAQEFTPELDEAFLQRLKQPIAQRGEMRRGAATRGALERGLESDPYGASARGLADAETDSEMGDLESDFGYRLAGMKREERLLGEDRDWRTSERLAIEGNERAERDKDRWYGNEARRSASNDSFLNSLIGGGSKLLGTFLQAKQAPTKSAISSGMGGLKSLFSGWS